MRLKEKNFQKNFQLTKHKSIFSNFYMYIIIEIQTIKLYLFSIFQLVNQCELIILFNKVINCCKYCKKLKL